MSICAFAFGSRSILVRSVSDSTGQKKTSWLADDASEKETLEITGTAIQGVDRRRRRAASHQIVLALSNHSGKLNSLGMYIWAKILNPKLPSADFHGPG
jgi:hypothetical protein